MNRISQNGWTLRRSNNQPVLVNQAAISFRGDIATIVGGRPPTHFGSTGRVWTKAGGEYFPSVFDLEWVKD
jgi:hypothetical protein